jgi:hypothetical protein
MVALICTLTLLCELDSGGIDGLVEGANERNQRWYATVVTQPPTDQFAGDPIVPYHFPAQLAYFEWKRELLPFQDQMVVVTGSFYFDPKASMALMVRPEPLIPYAIPSFPTSPALFFLAVVFY